MGRGAAAAGKQEEAGRGGECGMLGSEVGEGHLRRQRRLEYDEAGAQAVREVTVAAVSADGKQTRQTRSADGSVEK